MFHRLQESLLWYSWRPQTLTSYLTSWISILKKCLIRKKFAGNLSLYFTITSGAFYCERGAPFSLSYIRNLRMQMPAHVGASRLCLAGLLIPKIAQNIRSLLLPRPLGSPVILVINISEIKIPDCWNLITVVM
jgi:hypothetical protein